MISKPASTVPVSAAPKRRSSREAVATPELLAAVAKTLRTLRTRKGFSLERLAQASQVSRAMLGQIELAQSAPTITILWRIANALGVPFGALLGSDGPLRSTLVRAADTLRLRSRSGVLSSRPLFPLGEGPRRTEFYELTLHARSREISLAHPRGTTEHLVVSRGALVVHVAGERHALARGDALIFQADVEHTYENPLDTPAQLYLVMSYATELL